MSVIVSFFKKYVNDKILNFDEEKKFHEQILYDEKIKEKLNIISSFKDINLHTSRLYERENNILFSSKEERLTFDFDFQTTAENAEIFCEMFLDTYGCILAKFYFVQNDCKFYSKYDYEIFINSKNNAPYRLFPDICDNIAAAVPKSCKDLSVKISDGFEVFLNNTNDIEKFKNVKFDINNELQNKLKEKIDQRLSKEIFK